ncbi:phosphate transporter [Klebsormidium nitens]|uniref:Phosphate transporter n=1 Tax=Klebsormidium nitens TaxID=105231 RepID=A0A1Y1IQJ5_KLENI|nr:phosphate transporter [Klebsormidium nitens]|eukprot:GAQ92953.1 phosphate transporter [Klebsormidium nitens]
MAAVAELSVKRLSPCTCSNVPKGSTSRAVSSTKNAAFGKLYAGRSSLKAALRPQRQTVELQSVCGRRNLRPCRAAAGGGASPDHDELQHFEDLVEEATKLSASGTDNVHSDDESDPAKAVEEKMLSMAEAFGVSNATVNTIVLSIAATAIAVPAVGLRNPAIGQFLGLAGGTLRSKVLAYVTMLFGFYMAWNIGANDVANAMGTSVGSGALTLKQAIIVAAVLEFAGASLVGSHVTHTMQKGIVDSAAFQHNPSLLFCGMLASLASSGTWLQVASYYGWPVSTTHSIIGALVGFGLVYGGFGAVYWGSFGRVVGSWLVSPLLGAVVSFIVYKCIRTFVYRADSPGLAACRAAPIAVFTGVSGLSFLSLMDGSNLATATAKACGSGLLGAVAMHFAINQQLGPVLKSLKARDLLEAAEGHLHIAASANSVPSLLRTGHGVPQLLPTRSNVCIGVEIQPQDPSSIRPLHRKVTPAAGDLRQFILDLTEPLGLWELLEP